MMYCGHGEASRVSRVMLVSGKIYYDLVKERQARKLDNKVALIRVEELCPFPRRELQHHLAKYHNATGRHVCE